MICVEYFDEQMGKWKTKKWTKLITCPA